MKAFLSTLEQEWSCVPRWSKTWLVPIVSGPGLWLHRARTDRRGEVGETNVENWSWACGEQLTLPLPQTVRHLPLGPRPSRRPATWAVRPRRCLASTKTQTLFLFLWHPQTRPGVQVVMHTELAFEMSDLPQANACLVQFD